MLVHNNNLIHGQLDLSKIKLSYRETKPRINKKTGFEILKSPYDNLEFEITDFAPKSSIEYLKKDESHHWNFFKNQDEKNLSTK